MLAFSLVRGCATQIGGPVVVEVIRLVSELSRDAEGRSEVGDRAIRRALRSQGRPPPDVSLS